MIAGIEIVVWLIGLGALCLIFYVIPKILKKKCFVCGQKLEDEKMAINGVWAHMKCWKQIKVRDEYGR